MKRIHIAVLMAFACLQVAWSQQPTTWAQFHRYNMQRFNPYEKTIGVNNIGNLKLKWSIPIGASGSSRGGGRCGFYRQ
jgi:hypothetical protein